MKKIMDVIIDVVFTVVVTIAVMVGVAKLVEVVGTFDDSYAKDGNYEVTSMMTESEIVGVYSLINGQVCDSYTGFVLNDNGIIVTNTHGFMSDEQHFSGHGYQEMKNAIDSNLFVNNSLVRVLSYYINR